MLRITNMTRFLSRYPARKPAARIYSENYSARLLSYTPTGSPNASTYRCERDKRKSAEETMRLTRRHIIQILSDRGAAGMLQGPRSL